ncbi:hypothetical protein DV515_00004650 [Chloebia gouldiae]|uniref:Uncharacterized protein n=1 Tax=Chloebia gouldiae TaxID=44316 RepID=A0A3L8SPZ7_CHLGU|nr:hypothetical protein DV515_00004650 [Chloebia gouldiae]
MGTPKLPSAAGSTAQIQVPPRGKPPQQQQQQLLQGSGSSALRPQTNHSAGTCCL